VAINIKAKNSELYFSSIKTKRTEIKIIITSNEIMIHLQKEIMALELSMLLNETSSAPNILTAKDNAKPQINNEKK
jgi:hypothetical protein